jgi:hypothetical protein
VNRQRIILVCLLLVTIVSSLAIAQWGGRRRWRRQTTNMDASDPRNRGGVPSWKLDDQFPDDSFTFVRIRYSGYYSGKWAIDWPDSDLNFSYRLQQLTALNVHPNGKIVSLTDKELFDYPFIYLLEPGDMMLDEAEVTALRRYLLTGGFLMVDDFWGQSEWYQFYSQIKRVFPQREPEELTLSHEIFHCVYDLDEKPQIPSVGTALSGYTTERHDAPEPHYWAIRDDKRRIMAIICHNTDLGDGWEEEGVDPWYFREYSEKRAYPLGINIVVYAMTH